MLQKGLGLVCSRERSHLQLFLVGEWVLLVMEGGCSLGGAGSRSSQQGSRARELLCCTGVMVQAPSLSGYFLIEVKEVIFFPLAETF